MRDGEHLLDRRRRRRLRAAPIVRLFDDPALGQALGVGRPRASSSASTPGTSPPTGSTTSSPGGVARRAPARSRAPPEAVGRAMSGSRPAAAQCAGRRRRRASASSARRTCTSRPCSARPRRSSTPGFAVEVLNMRHPERPARTVVNGVELTSLPAALGRSSRHRYLLDYAWFFTLAAGTLAARHVRRPYTAVQVNTMPDFLVFAAAVPKLLGCPVLVQMNEPSPELAETLFGPGRTVRRPRVDRAARARVRRPRVHGDRRAPAPLRRARRGRPPHHRRAQRHRPARPARRRGRRRRTAPGTRSR